MKNAEIAAQIQEDVELYGAVWRSSFVSNIKRMMLGKGLRNLDIAQRLKVTEANVSRMLRGDQNLKIETMYSLSLAVGEIINISFGRDSILGYVKSKSHTDVLEYCEDSEIDPPDFKKLRNSVSQHRISISDAYEEAA